MTALLCLEAAVCLPVSDSLCHSCVVFVLVGNIYVILF